MTFLWIGFLCVPKTKKADAVLLLLSRWQDKRRFPRRGTERGSEERTEPFEPFNGARKARSDERVGNCRAQGLRLAPGRRRLPISAAGIAAGRGGSVLGRDSMVVAAKRSAPEISLPHFLWLYDTKKVGSRQRIRDQHGGIAGYAGSRSWPVPISNEKLCPERLSKNSNSK